MTFLVLRYFWTLNSSTDTNSGVHFSLSCIVLALPLTVTKLSNKNFNFPWLSRTNYWIPWLSTPGNWNAYILWLSRLSMTCTNPATWNKNSRGVGGLKQKCPPWGGGGGMDIFWNYTFTKKRNMMGKNPLPISLLINYYSLKINSVPCHHQRVKISEVAKFENSRPLRAQFSPMTISTKT